MDLTMVLEHLYIVLVSVALTVLIGLPLGILAHFSSPFRKVILHRITTNHL